MTTKDTPVSDQTIRSLIGRESGLCASIYLPTHRAGRETQQDPVRLRNLLSETRKKVPGSANGLSERFDKFSSLEHDAEFWRHQLDGLALFACDGFDEIIKIPCTVDQVASVEDQFLVRPLVRSIGVNQFLVLAITWKQARMYVSQRDRVIELSNKQFPADAADLVTTRDAESQLQLTSHRRGQGASASAEAMYHGHGSGEDGIEADRKQYLKRVADLVIDTQKHHSLPLAILATDEVTGEFLASTDIEVVSKHNASADGLNDSQLHEIIGSMRTEVEQQEESRLAARLDTAIDEKKGVTEVDRIATAATMGQVELLLVGDDASVWGTIDSDVQKIRLHDSQVDGTIDILDFAIRETIKTGGSVRPSHQAAVNPCAAILRY